MCLRSGGKVSLYQIPFPTNTIDGNIKVGNQFSISCEWDDLCTYFKPFNHVIIGDNEIKIDTKNKEGHTFILAYNNNKTINLEMK